MASMHSARVALPKDIPTGRVIGKGGSNTKAIALALKVRFFVDSDAGEAVVTGPKDRVDKAMDDLQLLFEKLRTTARAPRPSQKRHGQKQPSRVSTIHAIAAVREHGADTWKFEQPESVSDSLGDPNVRDFTYRLIRSTQEDGKEEVTSTTTRNYFSWIQEFDSSFQQRMIRDAASFPVPPDGSKIKLKAVLGMTCFALPHPAIPLRTHSWEQLQGIQLYSEIKPRWANGCNNKSQIVTDLLKKLQDQFTTKTVFQKVLTVFLGDRYDNKHNGLSFKFHLENDKWVPAKNRPVRVVHALYSVSLDNDTAFRIRACSRETAAADTGSTSSGVADTLMISTPSSGDRFLTKVTPGPGFPSTLEIRSYSVKEKTHVDYAGLRFTFSYMDAAHTDTKVECRLVPVKNQVEDERMPLSETMRTLLDKLLVLLQSKYY